MERVKETFLQVIQNQDVPFDKLVEEFEKNRDPSRNPLVQVVFSYEGFEIHI